MEKEGGVRCARSGIRMLSTSKGEPPAYCLSLCRRSPGHGMLHISHMRRQRVHAQRGYVLLVPAPSQELVEPAVRVYVEVDGPPGRSPANTTVEVGRVGGQGQCLTGVIQCSRHGATLVNGAEVGQCQGIMATDAAQAAVPAASRRRHDWVHYRKKVHTI